MMPRSSQQMTVSTTSALSGWEVHEYLGVVTAHVVAGTNIFSDIAASFSDIFGGTSTSYQKQLAHIHQAAVDDLCEQANDRGGTAIIGLSVDHDEISGGNRQLLMVTATGTVVRATQQDNQDPQGESAGRGDVVSADALDVEMRIHDLVQDAEADGIEFTDDVWEFIIRHRVAELSPYIRDLVNDSLNLRIPSERQKRFVERSKEYFRVLPPEEAKPRLYALLARGNASAAEYAVNQIKEERLLDWTWVTRLLNGDEFVRRKRVLRVIRSAQKRTYASSDIDEISRLIDTIESSFPKRGEVIEVEKSGMFASGSEEMWTIDGGDPVPMHATYDPRSGKDIYGFKRGETRPEDAVRALKRTRSALQRRQGHGDAST